MAQSSRGFRHRSIACLLAAVLSQLFIAIVDGRAVLSTGKPFPFGDRRLFRPALPVRVFEKTTHGKENSHDRNLARIKKSTDLQY